MLAVVVVGELEEVNGAVRELVGGGERGGERASSAALSAANRRIFVRSSFELWRRPGAGRGGGGEGEK